MVTIILSFVSLLILTPIVLVLPIGFSVKQKISLIGVAFLLANVGLVTSLQLPIYQTLLIILLLNYLTFILVGKRIGGPSLSREKSELIEVKGTLELNKIHKKVKKLEQPIEKEHITFALDETAATISHNVEDGFLGVKNTLKEKIEIVEDIQMPASSNIDLSYKDDLLDIDEDISFLANRAESFNSRESSNNFVTDNAEGSDYAYMSEIEKLIEENHLEDEYKDDTLETIKSVPQVVEMEELEEIELANKVIHADEDVVEDEVSDEMEIEELVFHK